MKAALDQENFGNFIFSASSLANALEKTKNESIAGLLVDHLLRRNRFEDRRTLIDHVLRRGLGYAQAKNFLDNKGIDPKPTIAENSSIIARSKVGGKKDFKRFEAIHKLAVMRGKKATQTLKALKSDQLSMVRRIAKIAWGNRVNPVSYTHLTLPTTPYV